MPKQPDSKAKPVRVPKKRTTLPAIESKDTPKAPSPPGIDRAGVAASLLNLDVAAIAKKLKAGQPLTAAERKALNTWRESTSPTAKQVSMAECGRHFGVATQTVKQWVVNQGCQQESNGLFDIAVVTNWLAARRQKVGAGLDKKSVLMDAQIRGALARAEATETETARLKGLLHSKKDCEASLTLVRASESRILQTMGSRIAAQFPELGHRLKVVIDGEVDAALMRLRDSFTECLPPVVSDKHEGEEVPLDPP